MDGSADPDSLVDLVIGPRIRPLGGLSVNRVWPTPRRRLIGPFIFFDHMQLAELPAGHGLDVPPHPHIGLATVTYLFEGEIMHADSMGFRQLIRPGELNWMTAGRGVTHAERTPAEERARPTRIHGIQSWVALPHEHENCEPDFVHYPASERPCIEQAGVRMRLIAGRAFSSEAPVPALSDLFYLDVDMKAGAAMILPEQLGERAVYLVAGSVRIGGSVYEDGRMLVLKNGGDIEISALRETKLMLLGGQPIDGDRYIWWNFVASSTEGIEAAKIAWKHQQFPPVPGDSEFMPLPEQ